MCTGLLKTAISPIATSAGRTALLSGVAGMMQRDRKKKPDTSAAATAVAPSFGG